MQYLCSSLGQPASYFVTASQSLKLPSIVIPLYTGSGSSSPVSTPSRTSISDNATDVPANVIVKSELAKKSIGIEASIIYGPAVLPCASLTVAALAFAMSP